MIAELTARAAEFAIDRGGRVSPWSTAFGSGWSQFHASTEAEPTREFVEFESVRGCVVWLSPELEAQRETPFRILFRLSLVPHPHLMAIDKLASAGP